MRFGYLLVLGGLVSMAPARAGAQDRALGDWHGVLRTQIGELTLIVSIVRTDDGALRAELETPDQAPGRKIPITEVTSADDRLAFAIQSIGARFEGQWRDADRQWDGTWAQGGFEFPLLLERGRPSAKPVVEGLDGVWQGTVARNGVDLRLILHVQTGDRGTVAQLEAPAMAVGRVPVSGFTREGQVVRFTVQATGARYEGSLAAGGTRMEGVWVFPGRPDAPVTFERAGDSTARPARPRPQTPKEPFDYVVDEVTVANPEASDVTLAGTLTLPRGAGPFPAAVLISGSGPQDRDESLMGHKPFAVLADHLTRHGIAVLRYDDRGFGRSTGDFNAATSADFATDAAAAVRYLRTRAEIDPVAIGLIGHSEGGMIAPIAAARNRAVAFVVLLAGPGTNTRQLMRSQRHLMGLSQGMSDAELDRQLPVIDRIAAEVAASGGKEDAERRVRALLTPGARDSLGSRATPLDVLVQQFTTPWFRYFIQYDPARVLAHVDVPVLALNGSLDVQVPAAENLAGIAAALAHNPNVTVREFPGLNHLFQTAQTGSLGEYADIPETFAPTAMDVMTEWINARFSATVGRIGPDRGVIEVADIVRVTFPARAFAVPQPVRVLVTAEPSTEQGEMYAQQGGGPGPYLEFDVLVRADIAPQTTYDVSIRLPGSDLCPSADLRPVGFREGESGSELELHTRYERLPSRPTADGARLLVTLPLRGDAEWLSDRIVVGCASR